MRPDNSDSETGMIENITGSLYFRISKLKEEVKARKIWHLLDEINVLEDNYRSMLRFFMANGNINDTEFKNSTNGFENQCTILEDKLEREIELAKSDSQYYSKLRFCRLREDTIGTLAQKYLDELNRISADLTAMTNPAYRAKAERIATDLFNCIFVTYPLKSDDIDTLISLMRNEIVPDYTKQLLTVAIYLGLNYFIDYQRIDLLLTLYEIGSRDVAAIALTAFHTIDETKYNDSKVMAHVKKISESGSWDSDITSVVIETARALSTLNGGISKVESIASESLNRVDGDFMARMKEQGVDMSDPEAVESFMSQEGIINSETYDKIRDIQERQRQGDDIFIGTFAKMRTMPFFNEMANWFMPFHLDHSAIADILMSTSNADTATSVADMVAAIPMMCDNDKYTMLLSLANIPASMREMAVSQMCLGQEELAALSKSDMDDRQMFRLSINRFYKNLNRFIKYSDKKSEFKNLINIHTEDLFLQDTHPDYTKIFDFLCERNFTVEAMQIMQHFEENDNPFEFKIDESSYYRLGRCALNTSYYEEAIKYLTKAIESGTNDGEYYRYLAEACAKTHRIEGAIDAYRKAIEHTPDDLKLLKSYYNVINKTGDRQAQLDTLFHIEYLDADNLDIIRQIASLMIVVQDFSGAHSYYERIGKLTDYSKDDYRMMGHLALVEGDMNVALDYYIKAINKENGAEYKDKINKFGTDARFELERLNKLDIVKVVFDMLWTKLDIE
jgi:tetratricopeptide (TPR) repeat protein